MHSVLNKLFGKRLLQECVIFYNMQECLHSTDEKVQMRAQTQRLSVADHIEQACFTESLMSLLEK